MLGVVFGAFAFCFGLSPAAGACYTLCTALGDFFYHTNCRTPRGLGYVFQRP